MLQNTGELMPLRKNLGLTTQEQIDEVRSKLHLEECDQKVVYAWMENERKENERTIIRLQRETKQKHVALAESINANERVIKNVFASKRAAQLSFKRLTADKTAAEMDQKACERVKLLNNLRYDRRKREMKLRSMKLELKQMTTVLALHEQQLPSAQIVRGRENSLDKARMKFETAKNIGDQYEQIVKRMKEESLLYPARLDIMEATLVEAHKEVECLKTKNQEANKNRDLARVELSRLERDLHTRRKERESTLSALKKEVERRQQEWGKPERRPNKSTPSQVIDSQERKALILAKLKSENQLQLLKYDALFSEIKHATGLTVLSDFLVRFENQNETTRRLVAGAKELQRVTTRLRAEKEELQQAMTDLKFDGQKRLSQGETRMESVADECRSKKEALSEIREVLSEKGPLLVAIETGFKTLFEKLLDVKLPPPLHNRRTGDLVKDLEIISVKFDRLLASLDTKTFKKVLALPNLHDILEQQLGSDNIRVKFTRSTESTDSDFQYELQDTEEVPSRDDIKHKGQMLVDAKLKPKKKKGKAKQ